MSATATVAHHIRYKDELKLMRAETVVSWFAIAFDRVIEALQIEPTAVTSDECTAKPRRYYGAYY